MAASHYRNSPHSDPVLTLVEREAVDARLTLLKRKGVYPYEWVDSFERFQETSLPPKADFFSKLSGKSISDDDYDHAQLVWDTFKADMIPSEQFTMGAYHDIYLRTDVLLLADVMRNFRQMCITFYGLDPWRFHTIPGFSLEAGLRMTKAVISLIQDPDMHLFIEAGMRGGVACISKRLAEASDVPDEDGMKDFLLYLDANNLYGWAMSQPLPTGGLTWEEEQTDFVPEAWPDDGERGCLLEVDIHCPRELHDFFKDYPPAPEKKEISYDMLSDRQRELLAAFTDNPDAWTSVSKLVPSLESKTKYVVHYRALKLYLQLGMKVTKVHRILSFDQRPWLREYIDFNTTQRAATSSNFLKNLFKLMKNSIFGKTMENVRNRRQIEFAQTERRMKKLVARPTFHSQMIISEELSAVENYKTSVKLDKPIMVGQAILDLSKVS